MPGTPAGQPILNSGLSAAAVTPSNTEEIGQTRAIYVGTAGNLAVVMFQDSSAVTFIGVPAGTYLPINVRRVMSTSTTATNILAIY